MYAIGGSPADGSPEDVEDEVTNEDNKTDETESGNNQDESSNRLLGLCIIAAIKEIFCFMPFE